MRTTDTSTCRPRRAATRLSLESRPLRDLRICTRGDAERSSLIHDMQRQSRPPFSLAQNCARGTVLPLDTFPDSAAVLLRHELRVLSCLSLQRSRLLASTCRQIRVLQTAIWSRMASGHDERSQCASPAFLHHYTVCILLLHSLVLTSTHIQHRIKVANHTDIGFASAIVVNSTHRQ